MALRITGLNELRERLECLRPDEVMARALAEQAQRMAARVREGLSEPPGGGGHDEPWLQSGALRDSVGAQANGLQAAVGSSDPAAVPQELGTARMPARPFLAPVAGGMGEEVARAVGAAVAAAIRGDDPDADGMVADLSGSGLAGGDLPNQSGAGVGTRTFAGNANATGVGGPLPAANGVLPDRLAPNLFTGPGAPTDPPNDLGQGSGISAGEYSSSRPGYHYYQTSNIVASAEEHVTPEQMKDIMLRFAVPGQSPDKPVKSGNSYPVYVPGTNLFVGNVRTTVSNDGLTTKNETLEGHYLAYGAISRQAVQNTDGSWLIITTGIGNNSYFGRPSIDNEVAVFNEKAGPEIFNNLDANMRQYIQRHNKTQ